MRHVLLGFALGLLFGAAATAWAGGIFGSDGFLVNWTVIKNGETVCDNPYVRIGAQELDCD